MASADYYLCDVCRSKTFYDAKLSYTENNVNPVTGHPWPDYVGSMIVLCSACSEKFEIMLIEK